MAQNSKFNPGKKGPQAWMVTTHKVYRTSSRTYQWEVQKWDT